MPVAAKICGINDADAMRSAVAGGAGFVGLVFYPPSPRAVTLDRAAELADLVPAGVKLVGLFVDPDDDLLDTVLAAVPLAMIQLHGEESPERCREIRTRCGLPVMKAIKVAGADDIDLAASYEGTVDWLMFDARAPKSLPGALPGGNALSFDWSLLAGLDCTVPWMLAGGINAENVAAAVAASGAHVVDTSSGVESRPGRKDPARIARFLDAVRAI